MILDQRVHMLLWAKVDFRFPYRIPFKKTSRNNRLSEPGKDSRRVHGLEAHTHYKKYVDLWPSICVTKSSLFFI
jgi:hypothetical protein